MKDIGQLKILHLEDNEDDAELIKIRLRKEGMACSTMLAKTQGQFEAALRQNKFDVILSDFSIPGYDGITALRLAHNFTPEVPFLFVSGTIGEDKAVETLRSGATDYILKERLDRLGPAIRRALRETSERALREKAEADRLDLEERLRQAQKIEAVGQLAGGIAHDFNNLLLVIQGYTEMLLLTETGFSAEGKECMKQVLATSQRASNLTRQLLTFSRRQPMALKVLNLNAILPELLKMLRRVVESSICLELDCQEQLPAVYGDQGMLEQVLMNLVLNARDAMPAGGELRISTKMITLSQHQPLPHPEARPGEFVCLGVQDTGSGIAPEHLLRIFEPFFTTKPIGAGTGLGLSTVYGIVKQHRGWVQVASELGKGTQFEVFLPVHTETPARSEERPGEMARGTERILLAEEDEAVRRITARVLEGLGYSVVEAPSGKVALGQWDSANGKFDLLLTDLLMTDGVTGQGLADKLRQINPGLKVIFTSGYGHGNANMDTGFFRRSNFLQKPYSSPSLAKAVRRCLDDEESI